jgi:uncharacterized surface protein with fasciclin (FAS1) repeats
MENLGNNVNTPNSGNGVASVPQDQTQPQVETSAHASGVVQPPVSTQVLTQTQNQPQIQTLSQAVLPTPVPQAPPQTVAQQAGLVQVPSTQNQMVKNIILGIFAVLSLGYCAYFFSTNQPTFFSKSHTSPSFEKLSIGSVLNRDVIKDRWSLVVVNAKEGILKDKKDVYRCDPLGGAYAACIVQVAVKNPQSFERVTNIFGKDSELVYVLDGNTNNYKVLKEASAPTFRPLYNGMTESLMGLYAGDDFHLFKGEKILTIKSVPTGK